MPRRSQKYGALKRLVIKEKSLKLRCSGTMMELTTHDNWFFGINTGTIILSGQSAGVQDGHKDWPSNVAFNVALIIVRNLAHRSSTFLNLSGRGSPN